MVSSFVFGKNSCLGSRQARAGGHLREAAHPLHEHRKRMCDQKNRSYCAAGSLALDLALALDFPAGAAGVCNEARRARLRSRFLAFDRLRVFSRALSFGMNGLRGVKCK